MFLLDGVNEESAKEFLGIQRKFIFTSCGNVYNNDVWKKLSIYKTIYVPDWNKEEIDVLVREDYMNLMKNSYLCLETILLEIITEQIISICRSH